MTLQRTAAERARFHALKAEIADMTAPEREARKADRKAHRKATKAARAAAPMPNQRAPREEDADYLAWIRGLPCIGCVQDQTPSRSMRCEAAHVRFGDSRAGWAPTGMGQKSDDRRTLPLCAGHHREGPKAQHGGKERAWWEARGVYPPALCAALSATYDARQDGGAVIRRFLADARKTTSRPRQTKARAAEGEPQQNSTTEQS